MHRRCRQRLGLEDRFPTMKQLNNLQISDYLQIIRKADTPFRSFSSDFRILIILPHVL